MKRRIVSLLLVFALIFSSVSAFAAPQAKRIRITSLIDPETITLMVGDKIEMPKTVIANMSDGTTKNVPVMWIPRRLSSNVPGIRFAIGFVNNYFGITFLKVVIAAQNIPVVSVRLDKSTLSLKAGGTKGKLIATVSPSNATNKSVTWLSSNPEVATVLNGVVTPLTAGTTTITVTTVDGGKTATSLVTVAPAVIPVTSVTLDQGTLNLVAGGAEVTLVETVNPANATNKSVTWSSSNPAVATVLNGVVTPLTAGTTTIKVTTVDGGKTSTSLVTVAPAVIPVTSVTLDQTTLSLVAGGITATLTETVNPANATDKSVIWSSSDEAVATVVNGVVTPLEAGTTTITVTTVDGNHTATSIVTVAPVPVTLISIAITTPAYKLIYTIGDTLDITGMEVTGTYSDTSTKTEIITTANVTGFDSTTVAVSQILTVTVGVMTTSYNIEIQAVPNTDQPAPTGLLGVSPTSDVLTDGKITGTTTAMEYKLATDETYTVATAPEINGLSAGNYMVRYAAATGLNAGADANVIVPVYAKTVTVGPQVGIMKEATPGATATFDVMTANIPNGLPVTVLWVNPNGTPAYQWATVVTASADPAVSYATIKVTEPANVNWGTYYFKVTIDGITSVMVPVKIIINPRITGVTINPVGAAMSKGTTKQLVAKVNAVSGAPTTVNWSSSDASNLVSVDANGLVSVDINTPFGTYIITATSTFDPTKSSTCWIKVETPEITSMVMSPAVASFPRGKTSQLQVIITTTGGASTDLNWTSSDDGGFVTVSPTGSPVGYVTVAADAPIGVHTITATSVFDPTKFVTAKITVLFQSVSMTINPAETTIIQGGFQPLTVLVTSIGGAPANYTWTTSSPKLVVTYYNGYRVTVAGDTPGGIYRVTATSTFDPTKTAVCTVTVPTINAANIAVGAYESAIMNGIVPAEITAAEALKVTAENLVSLVVDVAERDAFTARISAKSAAIQAIQYAVNAINDAPDVAAITALIKTAEIASALGLDLTNYNLLNSASQALVPVMPTVSYNMLVNDFTKTSQIKIIFDAQVLTLTNATTPVAEVNAATLETMHSVLTKNVTKLGLNMYNYNLLPTQESKNLVLAAMVGKNFLTGLEVKTVFEGAASTQTINMATIANIGALISSNRAMLGISETDSYNLFYLKPVELKTPIYEALLNKDFASPLELKTAYLAAMDIALTPAAVVSTFNDSTNTANTFNLLFKYTNYLNILGIDVTDYNLLNNANKTNVHTTLAAAVSTFTTENVKAIFDAAVSGQKIASTIIFADTEPLKELGSGVYTNGVSGIGSGALTYSSGNPTIATVDSTTGEVTLVAPGTTVITAVKAATATHTAATTFYTLTVIGAPVVSVTSVSLDKEILNLVAGGPVAILTATVNPANATNKSVTWSSSNPVVATIEDGTVTPLTAGTATITVTTVDGNFTYISLVTVVAPLNNDKFTAADISVSQPDTPDYVRFTFTLPAGKELEGATATNYANYSIDGAVIQSAILNDKVGNEQSVDMKLIKNSNTFTGVRNITVMNVTIKGSTAVMDPVLINNVSLNENVVPTVIKSIIKSESKITLVVSELVIASNDSQNIFEIFIGSSDIPLAVENQAFNVVPTDEIVLTPIITLTQTQLSQGIIVRMDKSKAIIKDLATNLLDFTSIQAEF